MMRSGGDLLACHSLGHVVQEILNHSRRSLLIAQVGMVYQLALDLVGPVGRIVHSREFVHESDAVLPRSFLVGTIEEPAERRSYFPIAQQRDEPLFERFTEFVLDAGEFRMGELTFLAVACFSVGNSGVEGFDDLIFQGLHGMHDVWVLVRTVLPVY